VRELGDAVRDRDLAAVGAMLATIVRRRPPGAWPIEEAPEWKALGHGGKAWLAFCNYLLNPTPADGELTIAEARKLLRKVPKDSNPVKTAVLTSAGVLVVVALSVLGFTRFGNPIYMPDKLQDLANKIGNPRAQITEVPRQWADMCVAWDSWLGDLQSNGKRLLRTDGLWDANDPFRREIESFVATSNEFRLETLVPSSATERRLGVLAKTPPPAVLKELQTPSVDQKVRDAGARLVTIQTRLANWQRWEQLHALQKLLEARGFTRAAGALQPKLPPVGVKFDPVRTLKLFNDISLDDTGTLPLASRWGEITRIGAEMDASGDRVQKAMPALITGRLTDRASLADFADSLTPPLEEMRARRKQFLDPQVVRARFLKESALLQETAVVTEADFPRWEQELVQYSKVPAADDPRLAAALDDSVRRLPATAVDLEADAPAAEPGGLPTLSAADFKREFDGTTASLASLRGREIVRHDLPQITEETGKLAAAIQLLGQRVEATLALLNPETWLANVAKAHGNFAETKRRWAAWQATVANLTAAALRADRPRLRQLRAQERQVKEWIDGLEGPAGLAALAVPALDTATPETASELRRLETVRREQTAVRFASHAGERLDRDVVVRWPVGARDVGLSLGTARPAEGAPLAEHAYGVLTLVPPVPEAAARSLPRDLTVLIDTSGSMGGFPLDCAKVAVGLLLASLGEGDRFELVEFNSARRAFREGMSRATPDATRAALTWVGALEAGGATEMHTAVLEAMRALRGGAQRQVVLVTDGYVGGEEEIVRTLLSELPRGCRLHFVGVGAAVNRALGLAMSRAGRGVECVIAGGEDPERALATLLRGTSAPVLTDVELSGSALVERAPAHLPDVFAGSPLRVAVKLAPAGGRLTLRGETARGRWERVIDVPATAPGEGDPGLVALFARERVADLETRVAGGGSTRSFDKEIERLGVLFQISTRLTSWVAVDAHVAVDPASAGREESVPQEVPHGTTIEGFGLRAASTSGGAFQETDLLSLATGSFGALAGPAPSSVSQAARGGVALGAAPPPQMARASHAMPTGAPMPMPSAAPRRSRAWVFALLLVLLLLGAALTFLLLRR